MKKHARILVVDDLLEEGRQLSEVIWEIGHSTLFYKYDAQTLHELSNSGDEGKLSPGTRIVFMDINLVSQGIRPTGDKMNFEAIAQTLNVLLDKNNGPWMLVTWTTTRAETSDALWAYLQDSSRGWTFPKPVAKARMDKERFKPGAHDRQNLMQEVKGHLSDMSILDWLLHWEESVQQSAALVLKDLADMASSFVDAGTDFNTNLYKLLNSLAIGEAGKNLDAAHRSTHIANVLASLMSDILASKRLPSPQIQDLDASNSDANWKAKIHRMLHIASQDDGPQGSGSLYAVKSKFGLSKPRLQPMTFPNRRSRVKRSVRALEILSSNRCDKSKSEARVGPESPLCAIPSIDASPHQLFDFATQHFFNMSQAGKKDAPNVEASLKQSKVLLIDITPVCDDANGGVEWRRFAIALFVPYSENLAKISFKSLKIGDCIQEWPLFQLSKDFSDSDPSIHKMFVNSDLQVSVRCDSIPDVFESSGFRIRDQLFSNIVTSIGRHTSRLGITSLY